MLYMYDIWYCLFNVLIKQESPMNCLLEETDVSVCDHVNAEKDTSLRSDKDQSVICVFFAHIPIIRNMLHHGYSEI